MALFDLDLDESAPVYFNIFQHGSNRLLPIVGVTGSDIHINGQVLMTDHPDLMSEQHKIGIQLNAQSDGGNSFRLQASRDKQATVKMTIYFHKDVNRLEIVGEQPDESLVVRREMLAFDENGMQVTLPPLNEGVTRVELLKVSNDGGKVFGAFDMLFVVVSE